MNIVRNLHPGIYLTVLVVNSVLCAQTVNAAEWWDTVDKQSGFSGFAPPAEFSTYSDDKDDKKWRSGSSFNQSNKTRYAPPVTSGNPWKPVSSLHYKKSFSSRRPWGNVPDRKPTNANNMKFHDQRFKQWSHQLDSSYRNSIMQSDPMMNYGRPSLPFAGGYGRPGAIYNSPLIMPASYPGGIFNTAAYGMHPGAFNPYSGLTSRPWNW